MTSTREGQLGRASNLLWYLVIIAQSLACGSSADAPDLEVAESFQIGSTAQGLYVLSTAVWPRRKIPVCWLDSGWSTEKGWVREAVESTWGAASKVEFTGWGPCGFYVSPPGVPSRAIVYNGIRIKVSDEQPHTADIGKGIDSHNVGMVLNFTFSKWTGCPRGRFDCIHTIAVHEFGHALGFAHEHQRPDSTCNKPWSGASGDYTFDLYDPGSVMNYCAFPSWPVRLSQGDVRSVQALYGGRKGMLVSRLGDCLQLLGGAYYTDGTVQLRKCGAVDQSWSHMFSGGPIMATGYPAGTRIWELGAWNWNGSSTPENRLLAAGQPNSADWSQRWQPTAVEIRGYLGKCLDHDGSSVFTSPCDGAASQRWQFFSASGGSFGVNAQLKASNGACVQGSDDYLAQYWLTQCTSNTRQKFSLVGGGRLQTSTPSGTECLRTELSSTYQVRSDVHSDPCVSDAVNEDWHFRSSAKAGAADFA